MVLYISTLKRTSYCFHPIVFKGKRKGYEQSDDQIVLNFVKFVTFTNIHTTYTDFEMQFHPHIYEIALKRHGGDILVYLLRHNVV